MVWAIKKNDINLADKNNKNAYALGVNNCSGPI